MPENGLATDGRAEKPERGCVTQTPALGRRCCLPEDSGADGGGEVIRAGGWGPPWKLEPMSLSSGSWRKRGASLTAKGGVCDWAEWKVYPWLLPFPDSQSPTRACPWPKPARRELARD